MHRRFPTALRNRSGVPTPSLGRRLKTLENKTKIEIIWGYHYTAYNGSKASPTPTLLEGTREDGAL